jgi:dihydrolipoamide dehydrogenase
VRLEAEMLLVAVGRMPFIEGLGLENTKVKVERGAIIVDEFCARRSRTSMLSAM